MHNSCEIPGKLKHCPFTSKSLVFNKLLYWSPVLDFLTLVSIRTTFPSEHTAIISMHFLDNFTSVPLCGHLVLMPLKAFHLVLFNTVDVWFVHQMGWITFVYPEVDYFV